MLLFASSTVGKSITANLVYKLDRISSNPNQLVRHFAPTWRSIKKIADIPYVIIYSFRKSTLPGYSLSLTQTDQSNLLSNLPNYPEDAFLLDSNKVTVRASFSAGSYGTDNADVRYRGNSPSHWNALKKSWQIRLPNDNPLLEQTTLRFVLPEDRQYITEPLNAYRAKKLGVIARKSDVRKKVTCYTFRHTVATLLLENGADIRYIQEILGHENLNTTQIYTRVSIKKLKEIHDKTHPANRPPDQEE